MTDKEFGRIMKRMEAGLRQEVTDLQFEEYLNSFGKEDARTFERAIQRVIDTQRWIPVPAQLREFIEQIQAEDQGKANRELAEKKELEDAKRKPKPVSDYGVRWLRFTSWMLQEKKKWPKDRVDVENLKAEFEKEHLHWQPRKRKEGQLGGMTRLGQSLGDAMRKLK